jgi:hypothetical protein
MKTEKKSIVYAVVFGVLVFLLLCAAESLLALRKAIKERDDALRASEGSGEPAASGAETRDRESGQNA